MIKRRKIGTLLILIGIGIPLLSFFFQDSIGDVVFVETKRELKYKEAVLDPKNPDDAKLIENAKILGKIDKPTSVMIGLDKEEITYTTDKRTGLIIMRWAYYYDYKGGFEIPYKYILALGIILALIGTGMVIFSYSQIEIKTVWKEHKGFLIPLFLVNIIVVFLLLTIKQHVKVGNILHVVALITLVFVTWNYAKQTQNLVAQEKISLEEQKKKNLADFWEGRLKEYYLPLRIALPQLLGVLSIKPLPSDEIKKSISKCLDLISKSILITKETTKSSLSLMEEFHKFRHREEKGISEEKWIADIEKKTNDFLLQISVEIFMLEHKIHDAYSFYIDKKFEKKLEKFRKEFRGLDEKRKKS